MSPLKIYNTNHEEGYSFARLLGFLDHFCLFLITLSSIINCVERTNDCFSFLLSAYELSTVCNKAGTMYSTVIRKKSMQKRHPCKRYKVVPKLNWDIPVHIPVLKKLVWKIISFNNFCRDWHINEKLRVAFTGRGRSFSLYWKAYKMYAGKINWNIVLY